MTFNVDGRKDSNTPDVRNLDGLLKEAVSRIMALPQFSGAEPEAVQEMVETEIQKGNITLYKLLRSVRTSS